MNRYNELLDWLQEEHNEAFNQWEEIEKVLRLEEEQKQKEEEKFRWEKRKEHINAQYNFLVEKYDSIPVKEDTKQAVMLSFKLIFDAVKKERYDMVSTYETAIRSMLMANRSSVPSERYLKDGRRVITPFHGCWFHNHKNDVKYEPNAEYDWRDEEE